MNIISPEFHPDQQAIVDAANLVVVDYCLTKEKEDRKRAKICKCPTCVQMYQDSLDRRTWAETFEHGESL